MIDPPDFFTDPNGPAFQSEEVRTGPPLDYVGEKIANSLKSLHYEIGNIERYVPKDLRVSRWAEGAPPRVVDMLTPQVRFAFRYGLVAFLALHNLLAVANDQHLADRLLAMSDDDFEAWLNRIREEGSVTG